MLDRKGIEWKLVELPPVLCRPYLRARGFPGPTVPAVRFDDGRRVQTTRELSRELDRMVPEPALFPDDPEQRAAVEEAERWGDEVYQPVPRRLAYNALARDRSVLASFMERPLLGVPPKAAVATAGPLLAMGARINKSTDDSGRARPRRAPGMLDRVDALLERGHDRRRGAQRGGLPDRRDHAPADELRDVRPAIEGRPAAEHATRLLPQYPGRVPPLSRRSGSRRCSAPLQADARSVRTQA